MGKQETLNKRQQPWRWWAPVENKHRYGIPTLWFSPVTMKLISEAMESTSDTLHISTDPFPFLSELSSVFLKLIHQTDFSQVSLFAVVTSTKLLQMFN